MRNGKLLGTPKRSSSQSDMHPTVTIDMTPSMREMLDWFADQPCTCATVGHIANDIERSRETVRQNLKELRAGDYAERRYRPTGEYRLITDPRNEEHD